MRHRVSWADSKADSAESTLSVDRLPRIAFCLFSFFPVSSVPVRSRRMNGPPSCLKVGVAKGILSLMRGCNKEGRRGSTNETWCYHDEEALVVAVCLAKPIDCCQVRGLSMHEITSGDHEGRERLSLQISSTASFMITPGTPAEFDSARSVEVKPCAQSGDEMNGLKLSRMRPRIKSASERGTRVCIELCSFKPALTMLTTREGASGRIESRLILCIEYDSRARRLGYGLSDTLGDSM